MKIDTKIVYFLLFVLILQVVICPIESGAESDGSSEETMTLPKLSNENKGLESELTPGQIKEVQKRLKIRGATKLVADGVWTEETSDAVRNFQQKYEIPVTGKLDRRTLAKLGVKLQKQ